MILAFHIMCLLLHHMFHLNYDYNLTQLKEVLNGLSIGHYNAVIGQKMVDGQIFVELDETILNKELGVTSPLDRLKMLKLIDGNYDPNMYLLDQ